MSDTITIIMPDGFNYLRSEEGIWAMQCNPKGLEVITDPENVAEDFELHLSTPGLITDNERNLMLALVAELKLTTTLYKDVRDLRKQLNYTQQENRELCANNRNFT